jgi:sodium/potassium/calcium exchanger 6
VASSTPGGLNYNIGSLFGAGVFVTTLVVGLTILNSGDAGVQLAAPSIWRDVGLYIVATLTIIIFGAIGELGVVAAIILLCLYAVLVIATYILEKLNPGTTKMGNNHFRGA